MDKNVRELREMIDLVGVGFVLRICRVHRTTLSRWLNGRVPVPVTALNTLRATVCGKTIWADGAWAGWFFREGKLIAPNGESFNEREVSGIPLREQLVKAQFEEIVKLREKLIAATRELARLDSAANDSAVWDGDVRTQAFDKKQA